MARFLNRLTCSAEATRSVGSVLGRSLPGGVTIGLIGPLGAGKTEFVKGVAVGNGLDSPARVTSPTFSLIHEYPGRLRLYHLDAYRLAGSADLVDLGFDELIHFESAVIVEWADRVEAAMPDDILIVTMTPTGDTSRTLEFRAHGTIAERCLSGFASRTD